MVGSKAENGGMRIGIDCRMWNESGIGRYIRNLVYELAELDHENEYVLFLRKKDVLQAKVDFQKVVADIAWYGIDEQRKFPKIIYDQKIDLMHFPHFNVPVMYQGKYIVTIHDLIHHKFSMRRASTLGPVIHKIKQLGYRIIFRRAIYGAEKIITVSDYVKNDLIKTYALDESKIVVTPEGVDPEIIKLSKTLTKSESQKIMAKKGIKGDYIFYVGNAHPHKNIEGLIESFVEVQKTFPKLKLVLAGRENYFWHNLMKKYSKIAGIRYLGFLDDKELVAAYKSARLFVLPSFEEGFGIPLLEAFTMQTPVVSSNKASLPEVGGDACIYFDPTNISDMKEKICKVLENIDLRDQLIVKGKQRLANYSWKKMAQETLSVYNIV